LFNSVNYGANSSFYFLHRIIQFFSKQIGEHYGAGHELSKLNRKTQNVQYQNTVLIRYFLIAHRNQPKNSNYATKINPLKIQNHIFLRCKKSNQLPAP
jgi:hypothetical protein